LPQRWITPSRVAAVEPTVAARRPGAVTETPTPTAPLTRFEALFAAHQRDVLAYAMRRSDTHADAEDVAAETFAIAWRKLAAVPNEPLPWLYAVARRVLANQRRGNSRRERLAALLRVDDVPTPVRVGEDLDGPAFEALASLSPADQEILRLVAWEDLRNHQVAEVLGITANAVALRLHRARARFADALARSGVDALKDPSPVRTLADVKGTDGAAWKGVAE
jgi:RNA polymerase sigma-70 factor (ECF subfamily)